MLLLIYFSDKSQDFAHVHSFKGHEHKVMAVVFVDGEQPLCISGDNEGIVCIWEASFPFSEVPMKKLHEHKDWRYSGIHAMTNSGTEYLYTGSGDRLVKAWSLQVNLPFKIGFLARETEIHHEFKFSGSYPVVCYERSQVSCLVSYSSRWCPL